MTHPFYTLNSHSAPPQTLKFLLGTIAALSLTSALFPSLHLPFLLGLSSTGIDQHFYWQFLSYFLIEPAASGISFNLFLQLAFSLYMIYIFGTSLIEKLGQPKFYTLFLGSTLSAALGAWLTTTLLNLPFLLLGPTAPLYGCLFAWTLLNAEAEILLFFTIPFKARTALFILLGATLLIDLSNAQWPKVGALLLSITFSYLFTLLACRVRSPFSPLHSFERSLIRFWKKCSNWGQKKTTPYKPSKVYDIRSGQPVLSDDQFMDAMLNRISLYGEDSLSPKEKKRMLQISQSKSLKK